MESKHGLLAFGFELQGFESIVGFARPQNAASRRVLEKIGMRFNR
ncbi:MAG: GNAT family N-acetyltransferase [Acidobacteria bacterium]|nr:GNAT family N-acetyltransferase [Acidobacteriota bacterium]